MRTHLVWTMTALLAMSAPDGARAAKLVRGDGGGRETVQRPTWTAPEPGHKVDGAGQLILAGTNVTFYLTAGSAQVDLHEGTGRVFLPAGARFKERRNGSFGKTQSVPADEPGRWYDRNVRRLLFLAGKSVGTIDHPVAVEGDSWMLVRGYNAAVQFKMDEKGADYALYRFPLRDPDKEAKDEQREKDRVRRLNSNDQLEREHEQYKQAGGLYGQSRRDGGGLFNGF